MAGATARKRTPRVVIVGSGVIGLSTGICLQMTVPGIDVTIVADKFNEDITSFGAAGIIRISSFDGDFAPTSEIAKKWYEDSFKFFTNLSHSPDTGEAGVSRVSGYALAEDKDKLIGTSALESLTNEVLELGPEDVKAITPNSDLRCGKLMTTYVADSSYFLSYLQKLYKKNGGKVEVRTVDSLAEFVGSYDVVVNCTGLRAKQLVGDNSVYPARGQVFKVHAPWIKHFYYRTINVYVIPGVDYVTVGGCRQLSEEDTDIDPYDSMKIMDRAVKLLPTLKKAKIVRQWAGLRPQRNPIRVEKEVLTFGNQSVKVVHNYGHGGYGVSLSWGTARHATQLVLEHLEDTGLTNVRQMNIPARL